MALPFFNESENRELVQRIQLASRDERSRHQERLGAILNDYLNRGLSSSTASFQEQWRERLDHQVKLVEITIDQVFHIVEAENKRLTANDEGAIIELASQSFTEPMKCFRQEHEARMLATGLTGSGVIGSMHRAWDMTCGEAVNRITSTVRIRAKDWERKWRLAKRQRRKEWLDRIPRWWSMIFWIGGLIIGWIAKGFFHDAVSLFYK